MIGTIFNHLVNFVIILMGLFQVLGMLGGLVFGVCWFKRPRPSESQDDPQEIRCGSCIEENVCPAAHTGVCFPCPYYKRREK